MIFVWYALKKISVFLVAPAYFSRTSCFNASISVAMASIGLPEASVGINSCTSILPFVSSFTVKFSLYFFASSCSTWIIRLNSSSLNWSAIMRWIVNNSKIKIRNVKIPMTQKIVLFIFFLGLFFLGFFPPKSSFSSSSSRASSSTTSVSSKSSGACVYLFSFFECSSLPLLALRWMTFSILLYPLIEYYFCFFWHSGHTPYTSIRCPLTLNPVSCSAAFSTSSSTG